MFHFINKWGLNELNSHILHRIQLNFVTLSFSTSIQFFLLGCFHISYFFWYILVQVKAKVNF